jgi:hypothetical protein
MQAAQALETILDRTMLAADDVNGVIETLIRVAEHNQSPAVAEFLLSVAQRLRKARGNLQEANAVLDDALFSVQSDRLDYTIRGRRK